MNNATAHNTEIEDMNNWMVPGTDGKTYRRGDLDAAFKTVQHPTNWKLPVNSVVTLADEDAKSVLTQAVIFFTGSVPKFTALAATNAGIAYQVQAKGYYAVIGA